MFWQNLWAEIQPVLISAVLAILGIVLSEGAAWLAQKIKELKARILAETKSEIVKQAVQYAEQLAKTATDTVTHEDKLVTATTMASELLNERNIQVSASELRMLIESVVNTFNSTLWS